MLNVVCILLLFLTAAYGQSNQKQATNTKEAIDAYESFNAVKDTAKVKQDSLDDIYDMYEQRIEQMKIKQQEREGKVKKPDNE